MAFLSAPDGYYSLTNSFTGSGAPLRVDPSNPSNLIAVDDGNRSMPLHWQFLSTFHYHTFQVHICTTVSCSLLCLAITNSNDSWTPCLTRPGDYDEQYWNLVFWSDSAIKITNNGLGPDWHLDVYSDTKQAMMGRSDASGQHWYVTRLGGPTPGCKPGTVSAELLYLTFVRQVPVILTSI